MSFVFSPLGALEGFGLVVWTIGAFIMARVVEIAGRHAELRDLRIKVRFDSFGGTIERREPIDVRSPLAFGWSYIVAAFVMVATLERSIGGTQWQVVLMLLVSFGTGFWMVRWLIDYKIADDERLRGLTPPYPIKSELVKY